MDKQLSKTQKFNYTTESQTFKSTKLLTHTLIKKNELPKIKNTMNGQIC